MAAYRRYDWEQATVDLTPLRWKNHPGRVVLCGMGVQRPQCTAGWWTMSASPAWPAAGTIVITKNLGQGNFTLTGLISQSGTAPLTTITNAPPGPYSIQFSDVAFYQTPLDQSDTLTNGGTITFTGNYGFIDANHNGISDSWERYYFGSANTNRTAVHRLRRRRDVGLRRVHRRHQPDQCRSKLVFLAATPLTNQLIRLDWAAIPGRLYQVQTSGLVPAQVPPRLSGSMSSSAAASSSMWRHRPTWLTRCRYPPISTSGPPCTQTRPAETWIGRTQRRPNSRRFYRTPPRRRHQTAGWTPVSDWLQATGSPTFYNDHANQGMRAFRVEVRP